MSVLPFPGASQQGVEPIEMKEVGGGCAAKSMITSQEMSEAKVK